MQECTAEGSGWEENGFGTSAELRSGSPSSCGTGSLARVAAGGDGVSAIVGSGTSANQPRVHEGSGSTGVESRQGGAGEGGGEAEEA